MITKEERESIINEATERALLALPETIGALMASQAVLMENNKKFYADYPEFKKHRDAVMSAVEMVEGKNPLLDHKEILKKAVPEIRKRIDTIKSLNIDTVSANPDRQFQPIDSPKINNPHGVI